MTRNVLKSGSIGLLALLLSATGAHAGLLAPPRLNVCQSGDVLPLACERATPGPVRLDNAIQRQQLIVGPTLPGGAIVAGWHSPGDAIEDIADSIESLLQDDAIGISLGNSLLADLDHAVEHFDSGASDRLVRQQLEDARGDVQDGVAVGNITSSDGTNISDSLADVIDLLDG